MTLEEINKWLDNEYGVSYTKLEELHDFYFEKYCDLKKENQSLKKQLENANEQINYLRRSIERKEETIIDLQDERIPYTNEYVAKLENQQKKFIEYLENGIDICDGFLDTVKSDLHETPYGVISANKTYITTRIKENETAQKVYKEILSKYKSIIGNDINVGSIGVKDE